MADEEGSVKESASYSPNKEESSESPKENDNHGAGDSAGEVIGSAAIRPVFLGNLQSNYTAEDVTKFFEESGYPVDRIDLKRGYCFVFLKDAKKQSDKERIEAFVKELNGQDIPNVSRAVRSEFARGDGRVKRKEDERRKKISPSATLFVVNFNEETTKRSDLEMIFKPYGELVRVDMKRNYAFVQFKTIDQATKAKDHTNGGKVDQNIITVEYVASQHRGGGSRRRDRYDDRRYDDRYDDRRYRRGRESPVTYRRRGDSPPPYRRRSRSRSPPSFYRDRSYSPPRRYSRRDEYARRSPPRGSSRDRDRGYRG